MTHCNEVDPTKRVIPGQVLRRMAAMCKTVKRAEEA